MKSEKTSAFIAVAGRPNVGKSSFINAAVGQKISIVSDKPQTTRTRIMGVLNRGDAQLVYIDTPGFLKPRNALGESMLKAVNTGFADADAVTLIVEAKPSFKIADGELPKAEKELIDVIKSRKLKCILGINKIDLLEDKTELLKVITEYSRQLDFEAVVPFSAKTGDGVNELIDEQLKFARPAPHYFDDDTFTDQPDSVMVCEIIREKLLRSLDKEVPHGIAVNLERFFESDTADGEPIVTADAVIYCEKESHKGIIIGKGGAMLKKIGTVSRIELEDFFGCKVNLKLWVKVKEDWRNRVNLIRDFGLSEK